MGAVPVQEVNYARSAKRVMSPTSTSCSAAPDGSMPCSFVSVVPVSASSAVRCLSAASLRA